MIVTLKKLTGNRASVDSTFPILAKKLTGVKLVRIKGKQLLLAGLKETVIGSPIKPNRTYTAHSSTVEEVRYVTFNRDILPDGKRTNMNVRMQYLGVDRYGYAMVRPSEAVKAGVDKAKAELFTQPDTGFLHIRMTLLRFD